MARKRQSSRGRSLSHTAIRCDALGDGQDSTMGSENRHKHEAWSMSLEEKELGRFAGSVKGKPKIEAHDGDRKRRAAGLITLAKVIFSFRLE
ncbi:hypothetical protein RIF29_32326 [Crotalaria pallida]|uniref:Uncharacterized protein n=1 Tax=Crotalaria pallida TaxID=3830 RepID=A0AAN9EIW5_CROPI